MKNSFKKKFFCKMLSKVILAGLLMLIINPGASIAQNQQQLRDAFSSSISYESSQRYSEAISALMGVYSTRSYEINLRLGWLHYLDRNYSESISYYKRSIEIMPVASEPLWGIINPYSAIEDWVNVERTYKSLIKLDPKNSKAHYYLGLIYYNRKNYTEAKKFFDVVLNLFPFDYGALLMSAWTNFFLGNFSDARVLFNKVLLYSPDDKSAIEGLSLIK
jgi:tetratricopeptide (TPR) repeat protein